MNILLTDDDWTVKISDFGVGRELTTDLDMAHTFYGTPCYLSPELCLRRPYNTQTDMWSLGIILYELCSLRSPFRGENPLELMQAIINGEYQDVPSTQPVFLRNLIQNLLKQDPTARPTAIQCHSQLQNYLSQSYWPKDNTVSSISSRSAQASTISAPGPDISKSIASNYRRRTPVEAKSQRHVELAVQRRKLEVQIRRHETQLRHMRRTTFSQSCEESEAYKDVQNRLLKLQQKVHDLNHTGDFEDSTGKHHQALPTHGHHPQQDPKLEAVYIDEPRLADKSQPMTAKTHLHMDRRVPGHRTDLKVEAPLGGKSQRHCVQVPWQMKTAPASFHTRPIQRHVDARGSGRQMIKRQEYTDRLVQTLNADRDVQGAWLKQSSELKKTPRGSQDMPGTNSSYDRFEASTESHVVEDSAHSRRRNQERRSLPNRPRRYDIIAGAWQ